MNPPAPASPLATGARRGAEVAISVLVLAFALTLYFQAATASLSDAYQPGIEFLRNVVRPAWVVLAVLLVASMWGSATGLRIARLTCAGAAIFALCLAIGVSVHEGSPRAWVLPEGRSLKESVRLAMLEPQFSNRSLVTITVNGLFAALVFCGAVFLSRRRAAKL